MNHLVLRKAKSFCYVFDTKNQVIVFYDRCILKCLDWMRNADRAFDIAKNTPTYH